MNLFPELTVGIASDASQNLPVYKEWAYDFEKNCFLTRNGKYYLVEKKEALKIWIYKAMKTARYRYPAYPREYGQEFDEIVGMSSSREIRESEAERLVQEALMVNPYITDVGDFEFEHRGSNLHIWFTAETVYGEIESETEFNYG